jgi:transcription elongation factor Elf1
MAQTFDAEPGESCRNDNLTDRFTCPNCYLDHTLQGHQEAQYIKCDDCGADLRCVVELIESSVCTIAYPDEIEEAA